MDIPEKLATLGTPKGKFRMDIPEKISLSVFPMLPVSLECSF
jgi:hypothetical protein